MTFNMDDQSGGATHSIDGACCYLAGVLFPIIFLSTAPYKANRFIRFHSFQSIIFTLMWVLVIVSSRMLGDKTGILATVLSGAWVVFFITWILLIVKAYQGRTL